MSKRSSRSGRANRDLGNDEGGQGVTERVADIQGGEKLLDPGLVDPPLALGVEEDIAQLQVP